MVVEFLIIITPVVLFLIWLFAEFRARTSIRIGLALAFVLSMLPMLSYPFGAARLADMPLALHRAQIYKAEGLLRQGKSAQVQEALHAYKETYENTHDEWLALERMESILVKNRNQEDVGDVGPGRDQGRE